MKNMLFVWSAIFVGTFIGMIIVNRVFSNQTFDCAQSVDIQKALDSGGLRIDN